MKPKTVLAEMEQLFGGRWTAGDLVIFHSRHKLFIQSHSPEVAKELNQWIGSASYIDAGSLERSYRAQLNKAFEAESTIAKNVSVLDYAFGILKDKLKEKDKIELKQLIEKYRTKEVPLSKPMLKFRKWIKDFEPEELKGKSYFEV